MAHPATFALVVLGGGEGQNGHTLYLKNYEGENTRKRRSIALNEYIRKSFTDVFVQVNIDVTRGHQKPKNY